MKKKCIIIGASHAGSGAAVNVRQNGWQGDILLLGDEGFMPYHRPPLSKDLLKAKKKIKDIFLRPEDSYKNANITVKTNIKVLNIDRKTKQIKCNNGKEYNFDKLILATGARVRKLKNTNGVTNLFYLRTAEDILQIQKKAETAKSALIIGGGYIGLETAASLKSLGLDVTIIERERRILQRVSSAEISEFYHNFFAKKGIGIIEECVLQSINKNQQVKTNKGIFNPDIIIVGIGVIPNQEIAQNCNLECKDGIVVNQFCQTSDKDIYAIGDIAYHYNELYSRHLRLESVPNANEMAKTAAAHICGKNKPHNTLPWFWSDAFDIKLQIAGLFEGYDDIVLRGDKTKNSFALFYFKADKLLSVYAINRPQEFMLAKKLIPLSLAGKKNIDKKTLANEDILLTTLLK